MNCVTAEQTILIVDDSDDDYDAMVRALTKGANLRNPIHRCDSGKQALDYLFHREQHKDPEGAPQPGIILLDLNMPGIDGRKVLDELKSDAKLKIVPVVVMTNSSAEQDIQACYELGANTYVQKPMSWTSFLEVITLLKNYWFEIAILPKAEPLEDPI